MITKKQVDEVYQVRDDIQGKSYSDSIEHIKREAFDTLRLLYPFYSTPKETNVIIGGKKIVLQEFIKMNKSYSNRNKSLTRYTWINSFLKNYDKTKIDELASYINSKQIDKQQIFIQIHQIFSKLKILNYDRLFVEHIFNKPLEYWHFNSRYDEDKFMNVDKITFDGLQFILYDSNFKHKDDYGQSISFTSNAKGINGVALFKKQFYSLSKEWRKKLSEIIKYDEELIFQARQLTARYEVLRKIL